MTPAPEPTLSVVMPNWNHGRFLGGAIRAIADQSWVPDELIVVDDGSTDDSMDVLEDARRRYPFLRILRNEQNEGTHAAVARGIHEASGNYLYLAASDDLVLPEFFSRSIELLERHPAAGFSSALVIEMDQNGREKSIPSTPNVRSSPGFMTPEDSLRVLHAYGGWFRCNTALYRRSSLLRLGGFQPELGSFGDAFVCMTLSLQQGCCFIPEPLVKVRESDESISTLAMRNVDEAIRIFGNARHLMRTNYRDLFPEEYVALWDGRWRYTVGTELVCRSGRRAAPDVFRLLPSPNAFDRLVIWIMALADPLAKLLSPLYLLLRLAPRDMTLALKNKMAWRLSALD